VILTFGDRDTENLFHGRKARGGRRFPPDIVKTAVRRLDMLNAAQQLLDLRAPPGNRLEALQGELRGKHSIRVNDQWRIVFRWSAQGPLEVRLLDYH